MSELMGQTFLFIDDVITLLIANPLFQIVIGMMIIAFVTSIISVFIPTGRRKM